MKVLLHFKLLAALDGVYKVDLTIHELLRELNLSREFKQGDVKSAQILMSLVCFGYVVSIAIDTAFMGEASCMMDLHNVCKNSIFNTQIKAALFMGSTAVLSQIGVGVFIMLLQNILLEIKSRVEKIQECLEKVTDPIQSITPDDLYPIEYSSAPGNANEVLTEYYISNHLIYFQDV